MNKPEFRMWRIPCFSSEHADSREKKAICAFLLCLLGLSAPLRMAAQAPAPGAADTPHPPAWYVCLRTTETLTLDGALEEAAWRDAPQLRFFTPVAQESARSETVARLLWDGQFLYVAFEAADLDLRAEKTQRDSPVFKDDVLEVFLQPDPGRPAHHNLEINALGAIYDGYTAARPPASWTCEGLRRAIQLRGTLNDSSDRDSGWTMEAAIPFAALPALEGHAPRPGAAWRFHLARYDYSRYLPEGVELSSCAPLSRVNFHYRPDWIELRFAPPSEAAAARKSP